MYFLLLPGEGSVATLAGHQAFRSDCHDMLMASHPASASLHLQLETQKLEPGCRMVCAGCASSFGFGFGRRFCSNFPASTARL